MLFRSPTNSTDTESAAAIDSTADPGSVAPQSAGGAAGLQPLAALLPAPLHDMEEQIDALFLSLNADALRFQEAYYSERRYLGELDQRRCAGYEEVLAAPAA